MFYFLKVRQYYLYDEPYPYNLGHFVFGYVTVSIDIVNSERPVQLFIRVLAAGYKQSGRKFLEVDTPVPVHVERAKHVLCKLPGIPAEQFIVDLDEVPLGQLRLPFAERLLVVIVPDLDVGIR